VASVLTLADGTPVSYEGSWVGPGRETSWNGDWELVGSRARAVWSGGVGDPFRGQVTLERYGSPPVRVALPALAALDRRGVLAELHRALLAGDEPECAGSDNLRSLATILALARSAEERGPVRVAELA
jgi:predicted dehydrogenase